MSLYKVNTNGVSINFTFKGPNRTQNGKNNRANH